MSPLRGESLGHRITQGFNKQLSYRGLGGREVEEKDHRPGLKSTSVAASIVTSGRLLSESCFLICE